MLGLGIPIIYRTAPIGDPPPAPVKQVVYQSDFTADADGWINPTGTAGVTAPHSTDSGLTDTLRFVSAVPLGGSRIISLDLSSFSVPSTETAYTVKFTFEGGNSSIRALARVGDVYGSYTSVVPEDTPATYEETITSTNPSTLTIQFNDGQDYTGTAYFKDIELFYYA